MLVLISVYKSLLLESAPTAASVKVIILFMIAPSIRPQATCKKKGKKLGRRGLSERHVRYLFLWAVCWDSSRPKQLRVLKKQWRNGANAAAAARTVWHWGCVVGNEFFCNYREPRTESIIVPVLPPPTLLSLSLSLSPSLCPSLSLSLSLSHTHTQPS